MLLKTVKCLMLAGMLSWGTGMAQGQVVQTTQPRFPMLMSKPVQKELKLSDEQIKKIQAKIKELIPEGSFMMPPEGKGGAVAGGDGAPQVSFGMVLKSNGPGGAASPPIVLGNPGNFKMGENGSLVMPDFNKLDEEIDKLLEQPQRDRLKQLVLQRTGLAAIAKEPIAKELGLDAEQKDLVKHVMEEQTTKRKEFFREMFSNGAGNFSQEKMAEFMKKQKEQIETDLAILLTPDQAAKWEQLLGPKFDFKK